MGERISLATEVGPAEKPGSSGSSKRSLEKRACLKDLVDAIDDPDLSEPETQQVVDQLVKSGGIGSVIEGNELLMCRVIDCEARCIARLPEGKPVVITGSTITEKVPKRQKRAG